MADNYIMYIIGIVAFIVLIPVVLNTVSPIYNLNSVTNETVTLAQGQTYSTGTVVNLPVNGELTFCGNTTKVFTIPTQCNLTSTALGTFQIANNTAKGDLNISYKWSDARYGANATERSIASTLFVMVILGLFMAAAAVIRFGG